MSFRQFNNIVGRLTESTKLTPYFPIRPVPLSKAEPPASMLNIAKAAAARTAATVPAAAKSAARMSSTPAGPSKYTVGPVPGKNPFDNEILMRGQEHLQDSLKKAYVQYQTNIHEPVYLKGGTKDKVLLGITLALMAYLAVDSVHFMWKYRNYK